MQKLHRIDSSAKRMTAACRADIEKQLLLEQIQIAVGYELLNGDDADIEQFVKDYIDSEQKEYYRMIEKMEGYN